MAEVFSNPMRGRTSFYDFSSLDGNGGQTQTDGQAQTGASQQADGTADGTAGGNVNPTGTATDGGTATQTGGNAGGANGGATNTATTAPAQGNPYAAETVRNYDDMARVIRQRMNEIPEETKEERERRERREKHVGFLARLADGLGTFHTAFAHARGEKAMDMPQMSKRAEELYEKQKAAREKNRDQRMNYAINIANLGNEKAKVLREMEAQEEARKLAREKAQREKEAHGWAAELQPEKLKEQKGKATTAEQKAIAAAEEAKNAADLYKAKVATERARGKAQQASATAHYAAAGKSRVEAGKARQEAGQGFPWWDSDGKMHLAKTEREAVYRQTQSHTPIMEANGEASMTESESDVTDRRGNVVKDANGKPVKKKVTHRTQKAQHVPMKPEGKKRTGVKWE